MTNKDLHRMLLKRLIPAWLILSAIIGFIVYVIKLERIDDIVVGLAAEEAAVFTREYREYLKVPEKLNIELFLQRSREHIEKGHFVIVELYDRERKMIAAAIRPGSETIEAEMDKHRHEVLMKDNIDYKKMYIRKDLFLLVFVPLKTPEGGIAGYFEGIYQADQKTMKDIRELTTGSVVLVVAVISITTLILYPIIISLNRELLRRSMELYQADLGMLEILGNAIAKRDSDTNTHNYRVTIYTIRLAEAIGSIAGDGMQGLIKGALLHDLGKIAISDNILLKPDLLTPEETAVMKTHVQHGVDIIRDYHWLADAVDIVSCHHEKYDGKGFLRGISGGEIPLHARIFAICDVFDALTSKRPYKEPFPFETSLQMIREMRGTHFDPGLVDAFSSIAEGLYAEINKADERTLKRMLKQLIDRYFEAQVSVPDGGSRAPEAS